MPWSVTPVVMLMLLNANTAMLYGDPPDGETPCSVPVSNVVTSSPLPKVPSTESINSNESVLIVAFPAGLRGLTLAV